MRLRIKKDYKYNASELETVRLINDYRISMGLNTLTMNDHISYICEEHNNLISSNTVNHNGFNDRYQNIIKVLRAIKVSENVAYNYKTSQATLNAWIRSPGPQKKSLKEILLILESQ